MTRRLFELLPARPPPARRRPATTPLRALLARARRRARAARGRHRAALRQLVHRDLRRVGRALHRRPARRRGPSPPARRRLSQRALRRQHARLPAAQGHGRGARAARPRRHRLACEGRRVLRSCSARRSTSTTCARRAGAPRTSATPRRLELPAPPFDPFAHTADVRHIDNGARPLQHPERRPLPVAAAELPASQRADHRAPGRRTGRMLHASTRSGATARCSTGRGRSEAIDAARRGAARARAAPPARAARRAPGACVRRALSYDEATRVRRPHRRRGMRSATAELASATSGTPLRRAPAGETVAIDPQRGRLAFGAGGDRRPGRALGLRLRPATSAAGRTTGAPRSPVRSSATRGPAGRRSCSAASRATRRGRDAGAARRPRRPPSRLDGDGPQAAVTAARGHGPPDAHGRPDDRDPRGLLAGHRRRRVATASRSADRAARPARGPDRRARRAAPPHGNITVTGGAGTAAPGGARARRPAARGDRHRAGRSARPPADRALHHRRRHRQHGRHAGNREPGLDARRRALDLRGGHRRDVGRARPRARQHRSTARSAPATLEIDAIDAARPRPPSATWRPASAIFVEPVTSSAARAAACASRTCPPDRARRAGSAARRRRRPTPQRVRPAFTSRVRGAPGTASSADGCAREIAEGAEDGGEMGALHFLRGPGAAARPAGAPR